VLPIVLTLKDKELQKNNTTTDHPSMMKDPAEQHHSHNRVKRENTEATNDSKCLNNYGGITLEYLLGKTMAICVQ